PGRQWLSHKLQYQKAGSYAPEAGDIIYLAKRGEGECHHGGVVEYVEDGTVHNIAVDRQNQCMRGHPEHPYQCIMEYGTAHNTRVGLASANAYEIAGTPTF
ncbi:CHAP domain-containing protein, partial [Anaerobutyricum soehngenii]|uniref:CHAP domain-containing protein n=1 Tax=Anaerobutyricum soehngenii TaxID=105843 RepID=UPI001ADD7287